jgi:hypothetical protein
MARPFFSPISSPLTTRRFTVEVFDPASTRVYLRRFYQSCLFRRGLDHSVFAFLDSATVKFFYRELSSVFRPTANLEDQVPVFNVFQGQGGPVILPGVGLPFRRLLRLAGLPISTQDMCVSLNSMLSFTNVGELLLISITESGNAKPGKRHSSNHIAL